MTTNTTNPTVIVLHRDRIDRRDREAGQIARLFGIDTDDFDRYVPPTEMELNAHHSFILAITGNASRTRPDYWMPAAEANLGRMGDAADTEHYTFRLVDLDAGCWAVINIEL